MSRLHWCGWKAFRFNSPIGPDPGWSILLRSILGWNEHVADAADGANRIGMRRIGLDFTAQPGDAQINGAVEGLHLAMGGGLQQPVALQRSVWVFGEQLQKVELAGRQRFLGAVGRIR